MLRLLIIAALLYGAYVLTTSLTSGYKSAQEKSGETKATAPARPVAVELTGMPAQLGPSLETARQSGPATLKKWIETHRRYLQDPKLGDIELDYAVAVARQNSAEARRTFAEVKKRTPGDSPLQGRLQQLARTFE